jgi:hypothetical protein
VPVRNFQSIRLVVIRLHTMESCHSLKYVHDQAIRTGKESCGKTMQRGLLPSRRCAKSMNILRVDHTLPAIITMVESRHESKF